MKLKEIQLAKPKKKEGALNQCALCLGNILHLKGKIANMEEKKTALSQKLSRLESEIQSLQENKTLLEGGIENWQTRIEELKLEFALTDSEIQSARAEIIRKQIRNLEKTVGAQKVESVHLDSKGSPGEQN